MPAPKQNEIVTFIATHYGEDAALAVWKEFEGCQLYIPRFPRRTDPKQIYIAEHYGKKDLRQIAKDLDISVRQVQKRLNCPLKPKQISLF
jgi:hypothetical protein